MLIIPVSLYRGYLSFLLEWGGKGRRLYMEVCEHHGECSWRLQGCCTSEHCILRSPASAPPAISPCCTAGQLRPLIQRKVHLAQKKSLNVDHFKQQMTHLHGSYCQDKGRAETDLGHSKRNHKLRGAALLGLEVSLHNSEAFQKSI